MGRTLPCYSHLYRVVVSVGPLQWRSVWAIRFDFLFVVIGLVCHSGFVYFRRWMNHKHAQGDYGS